MLTDAEMNVALEHFDISSPEQVKAFGRWCIEASSAAPDEGREDLECARLDAVRGEVAYQLQVRNRFIDMVTMRAIVDSAFDVAIAKNTLPGYRATAPTMSEAVEQRLAKDYARIGEQFMNMCMDLGCPDNTNMLDWARERIDRAAAKGESDE